MSNNAAERAICRLLLVAKKAGLSNDALPSAERSSAADFYARIACDFDGDNEEVAVLRDFFPGRSERF